jgi:ribosomal-protein-serine acetyltransferase
MAIALRPPTLGDAAAIVEAVRESADDLRPWMPWARDDYGVDEARAWIERTIADRERGSAFEFLITGSDGRILGACGLNRVNREDRLANLGYWVRTSAAGRGIAPEAARELAAWGFANTELRRFEIVAAVGNVRSQRVAEKAGAVREGVLRSRLWLFEVPHDAVIYSIVGEGVGLPSAAGNRGEGMEEL